MSTPYPQTVFVLGTGRDIGKTVTCVGVIECLLTPEFGYRPSDIGYMKPVGQTTVTVIGGQGVPVEVDKDAVLLTSLEGLPSHGYRDASPVVWQGGVTAQFIDDASTQDPHALREGFMERIRSAYQRICVGKRIMIVEGTGQPVEVRLRGLRGDVDVLGRER